jgi:pilus assembly protein Flp/PilA
VTKNNLERRKAVLGRLARLFRGFGKDESGLALTEYLILLGLLTAAVIAAVALFGTNLAAAWDAWAEWVADL